MTTNLAATAAIKSGLLNAYLIQNGWQNQYASEIALRPGSTYVGYDPQTGLNWAYANFTYSGPATSTGDSPSVAMQDGGSTGYFYQIPVPGAPPSPTDGWVMVGGAGEPACYSRSVIPNSVIRIWGLTDNPSCGGG